MVDSVKNRETSGGGVEPENHLHDTNRSSHDAVPEPGGGESSALAHRPNQDAESTRKTEITALVAKHHAVFEEAMVIFMGTASEREKAWMQPDSPDKYCKIDQNKPAQTLEDLVDFLFDAKTRMQNSPFEDLYSKVSGAEGAIYHFGIVIDSLLSLVPDPARTPVGVACK